MTSRAAADARRMLTSLRLRALGIADPSAADPVAAVRAGFALQGQDFPGALWSVGLRTPGSTAASVRAAHGGHGFVRSWPMRGTLHLIAPDDLTALLPVTGPRMFAQSAGRHRQLGITDDDLRRAEEVARARLAAEAAAPATVETVASIARADLLAAFEEAGVSTAGQRGPHLLTRLAQARVLVLVGRDDYGLLEHIVPTPSPGSPTPDEATILAELARRYLTGHGPATDRDLAWWAGITLGQARQGIAAVRDAFTALEIEGTTYLHRPGLAPAASAVHLLPGFDEYVLGYADRSAPLGGNALERVVPGGNGMFLATVVVDGEVVATWRRVGSGTRVRIELAPFRPLSARTLGGVRRALGRYADFLEASVELVD